MAYKPNGIFGKDVQVFVDDSVGKILKGDLVGLTQAGTGVLAQVIKDNGSVIGITTVIGQAMVEFDNALNKQLFANYDADHRYLACETQVVTYLNAETDADIKPGDLVYLSTEEPGKVSNLMPLPFSAVISDGQIEQNIDFAFKINIKALVGIALSGVIDGQVLVSMNK